MDPTALCSTIEPEQVVDVVREALRAEGIDPDADKVSPATMLAWCEHYFRENETIENAVNGLYRHYKDRMAKRAANQVADDDPHGAKLRHERNIQRYRRIKAAKLALAAELKAAVEATKDGEPRPQPPTITRAALEAAATRAGLTVTESETP